jgi:hypothetical protein
MKPMYPTALAAAPVLMVLLGCGDRDDRPSATPQTAKTDDVKVQQPHFAARLVICCGKSRSSSCDGGLAKAEGSLKVMAGALTCGHPGAVSKVSWEFLEHRSGNDFYQFTRVFPEGEPNATTTTVKSGFAGEKITLFEDANQLVLIEPATSAHVADCR